VKINCELGKGFNFDMIKIGHSIVAHILQTERGNTSVLAACAIVLLLAVALFLRHPYRCATTRSSKINTETSAATQGVEVYTPLHPQGQQPLQA
jgi:hypothetical protein